MAKPLRMGRKTHEKKVETLRLTIAGWDKAIAELTTRLRIAIAGQAGAERMLANVEKVFGDNQQECDAADVGFADWQLSDDEGA